MNNSSTNTGFFGKIGNALTGVVKTAKNVVTGKKNNAGPKNNTMKNTITANSKPVNAINSSNQTAPSTNSVQNGGMAPVGYQYPPNMRQPSDEIMEWATTAGIPKPITGMRNVAHGGGKRKTRRSHYLKKRRNNTRKSNRRIIKRRSTKRN